MGYVNVYRARRSSRKRIKSVNALQVLLEMAHTAQDEADPPEFWGSWERLAQALGHLPPAPAPELVETGDPEALASVARRKTLLNAVTTAVRVLEQAGLIVRTRRNSPGKTSKWELVLDPLDTPEALGTVEAPRRGERGRWTAEHSPEESGTEQSREPQADSPERSGRTVPKVSGLEEEPGTTNSHGDESTHLADGSTDGVRILRRMDEELPRVVGE